MRTPNPRTDEPRDASTRRDPPLCAPRPAFPNASPRRQRATASMPPPSRCVVHLDGQRSNSSPPSDWAGRAKTSPFVSTHKALSLLSHRRTPLSFAPSVSPEHWAGRACGTAQRRSANSATATHVECCGARAAKKTKVGLAHPHRLDRLRWLELPAVSTPGS